MGGACAYRSLRPAARTRMGAVMVVHPTLRVLSSKGTTWPR